MTVYAGVDPDWPDCQPDCMLHVKWQRDNSRPREGSQWSEWYAMRVNFEYASSSYQHDIGYQARVLTTLGKRLGRTYIWDVPPQQCLDALRIKADNPEVAV